MGPFTYESRKIRSVIYMYFLLKKGGQSYTGSAEKGAIRHAHPYNVIYRKLYPTPTTLTPEHLSHICQPTTYDLIRLLSSAERSGLWLFATSRIPLSHDMAELTLKAPRKTASENVVCLSSAEYSCRLFKPIFAYRQTVWTLIRLLLKEQSDLGPHCLQK